MKIIEEYHQLIKLVKLSLKQSGKKISNEVLARRPGLTRTYLPGLLEAVWL